MSPTPRKRRGRAARTWKSIRKLSTKGIEVAAARVVGVGAAAAA
jgi:hypothetical protein